MIPQAVLSVEQSCQIEVSIPKSYDLSLVDISVHLAHRRDWEAAFTYRSIDCLVMEGFETGQLDRLSFRSCPGKRGSIPHVLKV